MILALCLGLAFGADPVSDTPDDPVVRGLLAREQELMQIIEETDPVAHERLLAARETDRGSYLAALYRASKLSERARSDPAFAGRLGRITEQERQLGEMADTFATLPPAEREALRVRMVAAASALMDLKQAERRLRLEELRARLEMLEQEIAQRETDRDAIARQYVERLVR